MLRRLNLPKLTGTIHEALFSVCMGYRTGGLGTRSVFGWGDGFLKWAYNAYRVYVGGLTAGIVGVLEFRSFVGCRVLGLSLRSGFLTPLRTYEQGSPLRACRVAQGNEPDPYYRIYSKNWHFKIRALVETRAAAKATSNHTCTSPLQFHIAQWR